MIGVSWRALWRGWALRAVGLEAYQLCTGQLLVQSLLEDLWVAILLLAVQCARVALLCHIYFFSLQSPAVHGLYAGRSSEYADDTMLSTGFYEAALDRVRGLMTLSVLLVEPLPFGTNLWDSNWHRGSMLLGLR